MNLGRTYGNENIYSINVPDLTLESDMLRLYFANPGLQGVGDKQVRFNFTHPQYSGYVFADPRSDIYQRIAHTPLGEPISYSYPMRLTHGYPTMNLHQLNQNQMIRIMLQNQYGNMGYLKAPYGSVAQVLKDPDYIGAIFMDKNDKIYTNFKASLQVRYVTDWKTELKKQIAAAKFGPVDDAKFDENKVISFYHKDTLQLYKYYIIKLDPIPADTGYTPITVEDIARYRTSGTGGKSAFDEILDRVFYLLYRKRADGSLKL